MTQPYKEFRLQDLSVTHRIDDAHRLWIRFSGSYLGGYDEAFDQYVAHLTSMVTVAEQDGVRDVECHIEDVSKLLSRVEQAIYRMLYNLCEHVDRVVIYGSQSSAQKARHFRMAEQFLAAVRGNGKSYVQLIEVGT